MLHLFLYNRVLPGNYAFRIDERVVEYPWVLSRLGVAKRLLLDAGSASNVIYYRYFANGWQVADTDVAIIDSYLADIRFYRNLSNLAKVPVYMDDTKRLDLMVRLF